MYHGALAGAALYGKTGAVSVLEQEPLLDVFDAYPEKGIGGFFLPFQDQGGLLFRHSASVVGNINCKYILAGILMAAYRDTDNPVLKLTVKAVDDGIFHNGLENEL